MTTVERTVAALRQRRRAGFGLLWAAPVVATVALLLWQGPLGGLSVLPLLAGAAAWPALRQETVDATSAGRLLDRASGGKDHFLTQATLGPGNHPLRPVLEEQTTRLAGNVRPSDVVPPLPWRSVAGTAAGALFAVLLVLGLVDRAGLPDLMPGTLPGDGSTGGPTARAPTLGGQEDRPPSTERSGQAPERERSERSGDAGAVSPLARRGGGEGSREQEQGGGGEDAGTSGGSGSSGGPGTSGESPSKHGGNGTGSDGGDGGETRRGEGRKPSGAGESSTASGERETSSPAGRSSDESGGTAERGAGAGEAQSGTETGAPREGSGTGVGPGSGDRPAPGRRAAEGSSAAGDLPGWIIRDGEFVRVRVPERDQSATDVRTVPGPGRPEAGVAPGNPPAPSGREAPASTVRQPVPLEYRDVLGKSTTDGHGKGS